MSPPRLDDQPISSRAAAADKNEPAAYATLKFHTLLLALSLFDQSCAPDQMPDVLGDLDPDLVIWPRKDYPIAFLIGGAFGSRILPLLEFGVRHVVVMPYAALSYPFIVANAYSHRTVEPLPQPDGMRARNILASLLARESSTAIESP